MPIEDHLIEQIRTVGYRVWVHTKMILDGDELLEGHRVEAQNLVTGERWLVDALRCRRPPWNWP